MQRSYLDVPHVAKLLRVNIQTVRAYIRSGELPAARIGRSYVITPEDVDAFIRNRKEGRGTEEIGLTDKGKDHVAKVRDNASRILLYLEDCPGADTKEIGESLGIESVDEILRALLWLEGRGLASSEPQGEKPVRKTDPWYARK